jgi:hypothetical protein
MSSSATEESSPLIASNFLFLMSSTQGAFENELGKLCETNRLKEKRSNFLVAMYRTMRKKELLEM